MNNFSIDYQKSKNIFCSSKNSLKGSPLNFSFDINFRSSIPLKSLCESFVLKWCEKCVFFEHPPPPREIRKFVRFRYFGWNTKAKRIVLFVEINNWNRVEFSATSSLASEGNPVTLDSRSITIEVSSRATGSLAHVTAISGHTQLRKQRNRDCTRDQPCSYK